MTIIKNDRYPVTDAQKLALTVAGLQDAASHVQPAVRAQSTADASVARLNAAQTFTANQTFDQALTITGEAWNEGHLRLGAYHLWIDSSGRLMVKNGVPASDTDGTVVGTQT